MKTLSLWNISQTMKLTKIKLDDLYLHKNTSHELHVACLHNLPSYRAGIVGYIVSFLFDYLPKTYILSSIFRKLRWMDDAQIFSKSVSYINRLFPILNYGTWNRKKQFLNYNRHNSIFKFGGENNRSMSGMFSYFTEPFYDAGCAIVSNSPAFASDFIKFDAKLNRGMLWSYFDDHQVLVITISTDGNHEDTYFEIQKVMDLQKNLSSTYICRNIYIIGNFKREIIFDSNFHDIITYKFKIKTISPNCYLIHNFFYNPILENNIVKFNMIVSSPVHFTEGVIETQENQIVTMIPIEEDQKQVVFTKSRSTSPSPIPSPSQISSPMPSSSPSPPTHMFPSLIFNYFTSYKTPTTSPLQSPPSQSPKSDDGWSKV